MKKKVNFKGLTIQTRTEHIMVFLYVRFIRERSTTREYLKEFDN